MKKQENYKIIFTDNSDNDSKIIFAISKLVLYLENYFQNKEEISVVFSSVNYYEDNQTNKKNGEINLNVVMLSKNSNEIIKKILNNIIEEIKSFYKIDEILVKEINWYGIAIGWKKRLATVEKGIW